MAPSAMHPSTNRIARASGRCSSLEAFGFTLYKRHAPDAHSICARLTNFLKRQESAIYRLHLPRAACTDVPPDLSVFCAWNTQVSNSRSRRAKCPTATLPIHLGRPCAVCEGLVGTRMPSISTDLLSLSLDPPTHILSND